MACTDTEKGDLEQEGSREVDYNVDFALPFPLSLFLRFVFLRLEMSK